MTVLHLLNNLRMRLLQVIVMLQYSSQLSADCLTGTRTLARNTGSEPVIRTKINCGSDENIDFITSTQFNHSPKLSAWFPHALNLRGGAGSDDYYEILGVKRGCSEDDIRKAYR